VRSLHALLPAASITSASGGTLLRFAEPQAQGGGAIAAR
jgi:hypothetical protein